MDYNILTNNTIEKYDNWADTQVVHIFRKTTSVTE